MLRNRRTGIVFYQAEEYSHSVTHPSRASLQSRCRNSPTEPFLSLKKRKKEKEKIFYKKTKPKHKRDKFSLFKKRKKITVYIPIGT